ncbi:MAG: hypothetical protein U0R65_07570 [Candidatus Nanopelagicales bacterium]
MHATDDRSHQARDHVRVHALAHQRPERDVRGEFSDRGTVAPLRAPRGVGAEHVDRQGIAEIDGDPQQAVRDAVQAVVQEQPSVAATRSDDAVRQAELVDQRTGLRAGDGEPLRADVEVHPADRRRARCRPDGHPPPAR